MLKAKVQIFDGKNKVAEFDLKENEAFVLDQPVVHGNKVTNRMQVSFGTETYRIYDTPTTNEQEAG